MELFVVVAVVLSADTSDATTEWKSSRFECEQRTRDDVNASNVHNYY